MKTKLKAFWATVTAAFILAIFAGGCKDEKVGVVGVCPVVVSTTPANAASGIPIDRVITVTFNEPMNPSTIVPGVVTLLSPGSPGGRVGPSSGGRTGGSLATQMSGSLTYDAATFTITFVPSANLAPNATYTGRVSSSIRDINGNFLQTDYIWTFNTGSSLSPAVVSTDPANNATGVFLNKTVNATFSKPMDPLTLTASTFTLKQGTTLVAGVVSYAGSTASFTPSVALAPNTIYVATIASGAKDASGTTLLQDYTWTFTTGTISGPEVRSTDPLQAASGVALNKKITATFNESMDPVTITASSFTVMNGATIVSGTVSYTGLTATFTPTGNLLSGTTYTATITTGAKNTTGISLMNDYVWNFTTSAPLGPGFVDLKSVEQFGIIAGVGVSNNAGFSEIHDMNVGISPGVRSSITGFPPAIIVNGAMYASDDLAPPGTAAMLTQAKQDLTNAYLFAEGATSPAPAIVSGDQGGLTLAPGIYKSNTTLLIQSGDLTLDAQGDANAVWIFQIASGFTTVGGAGGNVILTGGAQAKNVFWQVGSSATIGDFTSFKGNILALTSITMNSGATAVGRMLARNGSVVLTNTNIINKP